MAIQENVQLAERTTLGVGGPARWFARIESEGDLEEALEFARARSLPVRVLGAGSNLVISDRGVEGLVLALAIPGVRFEDAGTNVVVRAGAGEPWDSFVERTLTAGLAGLECLSGIPGLVGSTPIQNVGAYGQEVGDTIVEVRAFDRTHARFVTLPRAELELGYRQSRFKARDRDRFIVTEVSFALRRGTPEPPRYAELARSLTSRGHAPSLMDVRSAVLALRRAKSMLWDPSDENARSCGSFFMNPVVPLEQARALGARFGDTMPRYPQPDGVKLSAAWLIERAGLTKGTRDGNVGLSSRHALAIVCHAGASASEVLAFAKRVQRAVFTETGVELHPEPVFW